MWVDSYDITTTRKDWRKTRYLDKKFGDGIGISLVGGVDDPRNDVELDEAVKEFNEEIELSEMDIKKGERVLKVMADMREEMEEGFKFTKYMVLLTILLVGWRVKREKIIWEKTGEEKAEDKKTWDEIAVDLQNWYIIWTSIVHILHWAHATLFYFEI